MIPLPGLRWLAQRLVALLSRFVILGDGQQDPGRVIRVGILSGELRLDELRFKEGALEKLGLPVHLLEASIGSVSIVVPWTRIATLSAKVQVKIEDVRVVIEPSLDGDEEEAERRRRKATLSAKQAMLRSIEAALQATDDGLAARACASTADGAPAADTASVGTAHTTKPSLASRFANWS